MGHLDIGWFSRNRSDLEVGVTVDDVDRVVTREARLLSLVVGCQQVSSPEYLRGLHYRCLHRFESLPSDEHRIRLEHGYSSSNGIGGCVQGSDESA